MTKLSFHVLFCSVFYAFVLLLSRPAVSQEVDDESGFNYDEDGNKGPSRWGELNVEWQECNSGKMQSPIDLLHKRVQIVPKFVDFKIAYKPTNATLKNRGHDIMIKEHLEEISETNEYIEVNDIDPSLLRMDISSYYQYFGSLTTPPCTQNVLWIIAKKVRSVAPSQVELLRVAVHDDSNTNARPLQPLNNRMIQLRFRSQHNEKEH
ncbi:hypothetical protein IC582_028299 [Cucumis melo]